MSTRSKVLVNADLHPDGLRALEEGGFEIVHVPESNPAGSLAAAPDVVGVVANASLPFNDSFFDRAPGLKVIGRVGVGYDNVDIEAARRRGIRVLNTPLPVIEPVAEQTFLLFLAVARRLLPGDAAVRSGRWREPANIPGPELRGKTLGIIGLGNTGRRVAEIGALAFQMKIVYFDKIPRPEAEGALGARHLPLPDVLAASDFASIHVNLSPETRGLVGRVALERAKTGCILVNVSRGPVVDEDALVDALRAGRLGGAGLDVFAVEPPRPDHPLFQLPNVVLSPHIGGASQESKRGVSMVALDVIRVLRGEAPVHPVC